METTIINFWKCFQKVQLDLLIAHEYANKEMLQWCLNPLFNHPTLKENKLDLIIYFPSKNNPQAKLCFLTKGVKKRKRIAYQIMEEAPQIENWKYQVGIPPYSNPREPLSFYVPFIKRSVDINQVFVHIHKIYKSTNKLHLHVFIELHKTGVPKEKIRPLAMDFLQNALGDEKYYKNISMIKIVRRMTKKNNFFPLDQLAHLIEYKTPY